LEFKSQASQILQSFATVRHRSISTQVPVLSWHYVTEIDLHYVRMIGLKKPTNCVLFNVTLIFACTQLKLS